MILGNHNFFGVTMLLCLCFVFRFSVYSEAFKEEISLLVALK